MNNHNHSHKYVYIYIVYIVYIVYIFSYHIYYARNRGEVAWEDANFFTATHRWIIWGEAFRKPLNGGNYNKAPIKKYMVVDK